MFRGWGQAHRLALSQMDGQAASRGTEAADHFRRRVGSSGNGNLAQAEPARRPRQLACQPTISCVEQGR